MAEMKSSIAIPQPPGRAWAPRAGNGLTMSQMRLVTKASARTGALSGRPMSPMGNVRYSSATMRLSSLRPKCLSAAPQIGTAAAARTAQQAICQAIGPVQTG